MTTVTCHSALYHSCGQQTRGWAREDNYNIILDSHDGTIIDERDTKLWRWLCGEHISIQSKLSSFVTSLERNSRVRSVR